MRMFAVGATGLRFHALHGSPSRHLDLPLPASPGDQVSVYPRDHGEVQDCAQRS